MHHDTSVSSLPDSKVDSLTGRKPAKMEDARRQSGTGQQLPGRSQSHITCSLANDEKLMVQLVCIRAGPRCYYLFYPRRGGAHG